MLNMPTPKRLTGHLTNLSNPVAAKQKRAHNQKKTHVMWCDFFHALHNPQPSAVSSLRSTHGTPAVCILRIVPPGNLPMKKPDEEVAQLSQQIVEAFSRPPSAHCGNRPNKKHIRQLFFDIF